MHPRKLGGFEQPAGAHSSSRLAFFSLGIVSTKRNPLEWVGYFGFPSNPSKKGLLS